MSAAVLDAVTAVLLVGALAALAVVDLRRRLVPNVVVLPASAVVLALRTLAHPSPVWALAGLGAAAFFLAASLARPGALGMGDVKLALLLGCALGREVVAALALGLLAAALPSLVVLARRGWRARTATIPLAPFLGLGGVLALLLAGPAVGSPPWLSAM